MSEPTRQPASPASPPDDAWEERIDYEFRWPDEEAEEPRGERPPRRAVPVDTLFYVPSAPAAPAAAAEPPGVDLLVALRSRFLAFLIPVLVVTGLCIAYGLVRDEEFKSETRLSVGRLDIATQGIAGFAQAEVSIASALSRAVDSPGVIQPAAKAAGVPVETAAQAVSATPVANAPLIRVEAVLEDRQQAIDLVNAVATQMVRYVKELGTTGGDVQELSEEYARLSREVTRLRLARNALLAAYRDDPVYLNRYKYQSAEGKLEQTILQRNSVGNTYSLQASGLTAAHLLGVLAPAYRAEGDRASSLEKLAITGLIAGIVLGLAVVGWLEAGERRRRREDPTPAPT